MHPMCNECNKVCSDCRFDASATTWLDVGRAFFDLRRTLREYGHSGNFTEQQKAEACTMLDGLKLQLMEGCKNG